MKRIARFLAASLVVFMLASTVIAVDPEPRNSPSSNVFSSLSSHDVIIIDGNDEFNAAVISEGWHGSGVPSDPYIIENYAIDAEGELNCIKITNTTVHFTIRNCTLSNTSSNQQLLQWIGAVYIENCTRVFLVNITIVNSSLSGVKIIDSRDVRVDLIQQNITWYGISITDSGPNITARNCILSQMGIGITSYNSNGLRISNNRIDNISIGIGLSDCRDGYIDTNIIDDATTDSAISISRSSNLDIFQNEIRNSIRGIKVQICNSLSIRNNRITSPFISFWPVSGLYIDGSNNCLVEQLDVLYAYTGIFIQNSNNLRLSYIITIDCTVGIHGDHITNLTLESSLVRGGDFGILMGNTSASTFENLAIDSPVKRGIHLYRAMNSEFNSFEISGYTEIGLYSIYSWGNTFDKIIMDGPDVGIVLEYCTINKIWNSEIASSVGEAVILKGSTQNDLVHNIFRSGDPHTALRIGPGSYSNEFYSNHLFVGGMTFTSPNNYDDDIDMELYESQYVEISNTYEGRFIIYLNGDDIRGDTLVTSYGQIFVINSTNANFRNQNLDGGGVGLTIIGSENINFYSSWISGCGDNNILISDSENIWLSENNIFGGMGAGISILDSSDVSLLSTRIEECGSGVIADNTNNVSMRSSTFSNINTTCLRVNGSEEWNVSGLMVNNSLSGIKFDNTINSIIHDSYFEQLDEGLRIQNGNNITIQENSIFNIQNQGNAMFLYRVDSCDIHGNYVRTAYRGISTEYCKELYIFDNLIDHASSGIQLTDTRISELKNNTIQDSYYRGLWMENCNSNRVSYNLFIRSKSYAILSSDSWVNTIWHNSFLGNNGVTDYYQSHKSQVFDDDNSKWYDTLKGGNYYSDMQRPDWDEDGFIDDYYNVAGGDNWDRNPLAFSPIDIIEPPRNLTTANGSYQVMLTWEQPEDISGGEVRGFDVDTYKIYRSETQEDFKYLDEVYYPSTYYYDQEITPGKIYYYQVRAYCYVGAGAPSNIASGFADETGPVINILFPQSYQWFNSPDILISWEGADPESGIGSYSIRIDYGDWIDLENETTYLIRGMDPGSHRVDIRGVNSVGVMTTENVDFNVDYVDPILDISGPQEFYTKIISHSIRWDSEDEDSDIQLTEYRLNDGPWVKTDLDKADINLIPGTNTFDVVVFDLAGNMANERLTITYDGDDPVFTSVYPDTGAEVNTNSGSVELSWVCEDQISGVDRYEVAIADGVTVQLESSATGHILQLTEGFHVVRLKVWDKAGNSAFREWNIYVDKTPPTIVSFSPKGGFIPVGANISVVFSERMFVGSVFLGVRDVSGRLSWTGNRLTFYPHQLLEFGKTYEVTVYGADTSSNYMESFLWEFSTLPAGTIRGRIVGERGKPIFDASVTLQNGEVYYTDNQGRFGIEVPPGDYTLIIEKSGYETKTIKVTVLSGGEEDLGNIEMDKGGLFSALGLFIIIGIPVFLLLSLIIILTVVIIRRKSKAMDFYVVDGEPVQKKRTVVEFEEEEDGDYDFEIIDFNGSPDLYSVLGIDRYASASEIKRAYRNMAYMYHPDKLQAAGIDMDIEEIHVMMRELNEAKDTLLDPMKRQAYDITLLDKEL